MHVIAAKAVAFKEAMAPEFKGYQQQIVKNAKTLAQEMSNFGFRIVSGGTDTHLMLVDLTKKNITGAEASKLLEEVNITANKNLIPFDTQTPQKTSGVRLGTPAVTTRGMKEREMKLIATYINDAIEARLDQAKLKKIKDMVLDLTRAFPLYPELRNA